MQESTELWKQLCAQVAVEKDPDKLRELTKQINDLLLGKQHRLKSEPGYRVATSLRPCGPACTVVWQGRTGNRSPYADLPQLAP